MITYTKMDPDFKKKWITALLSGDYEQTRGRLKAEYMNAFCCLGVACDLAESARWMNSIFIFDGLAYPVVVPGALKEKWNLDQVAIDVLIRMNDSGTSFKNIAAWIEENL